MAAAPSSVALSTTENVCRWLDERGLQDFSPMALAASLSGVGLLNIDEAACVRMGASADLATRVVGAVRALKSASVASASVSRSASAAAAASSSPLEGAVPVNYAAAVGNVAAAAAAAPAAPLGSLAGAGVGAVGAVSASGASAVSTSREDYMCMICMDLWMAPVTVECGHTFCRSCLATWLLENPSCPVDRHALTPALPMINATLKERVERLFPAEMAARTSGARSSSAEERLERARRETEERERKQKIEQLKRNFRGHGVVLDDASLEAVLAVCDGDVQAAVRFLQLEGEPPADFVDVRDVGTGQGAVPRDYMRLPDVSTLAPLPAVAPAHSLEQFLKCFNDGDMPLTQHVALQTNHFAVYRSILLLCVNRGIDLTPGVKARVLAACWARRDYAFSEQLMGAQCRGILDLHEGHADLFGTMDILKALRLLDAGRQVRVLERKIALLRTAAALPPPAAGGDAGPAPMAVDAPSPAAAPVGAVAAAVAAPAPAAAAAAAAARGGRRAVGRGRGVRGGRGGRGVAGAGGRGRGARHGAGGRAPMEAGADEEPGLDPRRARKVRRLQRQIEELQKDAAPCSLSGALARHVRDMISRIPKSKLEFFALQMPGDPWKEICDLLHVNPAEGVTVPWFIPRCFGDAAPADSIVAGCEGLNGENAERALEIIERFHPPYSFVRLRCPHLTPACRVAVVRYTSLDQCLWWYEDLRCNEIDSILVQRLRAGERPSLPYGKLMERLMTLRSLAANSDLLGTLLALAEQRLQGMRLTLAPPVVVLGDASYSMDVAIRVSAIMASVLAVLSHAELRFFNTVSFSPATVPQTASQVLEVAATMHADGPTAPASALWEYFHSRRPVSTFVVVTDERENTRFNDTYFPLLFRRYVTEVHPARLVLVSFLEPNTKGQMATALEALGIRPLQFSLDGRRPDLTRLDGLMGLLSSSTEGFEAEVVEHMRGDGMEGGAAAAAVSAASSSVAGGAGAAAAAGAVAPAAAGAAGGAGVA